MQLVTILILSSGHIEPAMMARILKPSVSVLATFNGNLGLYDTDHPLFSCSKIEQKQWGTWGSFRSAATGVPWIHVVTTFVLSILI